MNTRGTLAVIAAGLLWTSAGWVGDDSPSGLTPIVLAEARLILGGVALLLWSGPGRAWAAGRSLPRRTLCLAVAAMAVFQWGFFIAIPDIGSSMTILLTTAIGPAAAQLLAAARTRVRLGRRWKLASALLAATAAASASNDPAALRGVLAAVASGLAYAVYASVIAGDTDDRGGSAGTQSLVTTGLSLAGAGAVLAPFAWRSTWPALDATSLARLLYLGLLATALAYALFASGLRVLRADQALSLLAIQPAAAVAADLLHHSSEATDRPWAISLAGAALLLLLLPWPLIPLRRRGGGTAPHDESPSQCP